MSEYEEWKSIIPLKNFDSNVKSLKLNDEICLNHISNGELKKIIDTFQSSRRMLRIALTDVNFVIEMNALTTIKGKPVVIFDHMQPRVQNVILALRLLKSGDVTASCGFLLDENRKASGLAGFPKPLPSQNRYLLKQEETDRFVELWEKLRRIEIDKPHLRFPLFRFNKAFETTGLGESILEYIITLESLVFREEEKSIEPAGKVMGIAIGMLIGKNEQERAKIKKKLIKAYKVRNALVHGNLKKIKKYQSDFPKVSTEIEDYLRRALRKFVEE